MKRTIALLLVLPFFLTACGEDGTVEPGNATPFTSFPVVLSPAALSNRAALKVYVADGSGGWTDVSSQVSRVECEALDSIEQEATTGDDLTWYRFISESSVAFVSPDDPTTPQVTGSYTRTGGSYTLTFDHPFSVDPLVIKGRAEGGKFYVPTITICMIEDDQTSRVESSETTPYSGTEADVINAFEFSGDTVAFVRYDVEYVKE